MSKILTGAAAAASLLLAGCAGSLETSPNMDRTGKLGEAMRGVSYTLPKAQYKMAVERTLVECPGNLDKDKKPTSLKFDVKVSGVGDYVPGESYTIAYEELAGLMRTANFEIKYWPNGNLKSLGAAAEDKTGDVLRDTLKTGFSIASAATGFGILPLSGGGDDDAAGAGIVQLANSEFAVVCTEEAEKAVAERQKQVDALDKLEKKLTTLKNNVEDINARGTVKLATMKDRRDLAQYSRAIRTHAGEIAAAKEARDTAEKKLKLSETMVWNSEGDDPVVQEQTHVLPEGQAEEFKKLLKVASVATALLPGGDHPSRTSAPGCYGASASTSDCLSAHLNLVSKIVFTPHLPECEGLKEDATEEEKAAYREDPRQGKECVLAIASSDARYRDARDNDPDAGIFFREQRRGQLLFCRASAPKCSSASDLAKLAAGNFPQLGQLRYLPLKVGPFQAREMGIALSEDGKIETFSYKSTKSVAAGLAAAAADAAAQADSFQEKRETEKRDDFAFARTELKADREDVAYERSEVAYERSETAFQRTEAAAILQAEITRLTNENALEKLRNPAPPTVDPLKPLVEETAAINAQVALLKARLAQIQAEAALAEAQR